MAATSPSRAVPPPPSPSCSAPNEVDGIHGSVHGSHPHDFTPDVIDAMAESEHVCEHIHFLLQSGLDRVLGLQRGAATGPSAISAGSN